MTDRIRVKQTNRKEAMARALAMLIIGFGVLLIGAGWWVQQSTKTRTPSLNELQALAAQPLPPTSPITQPIIAEPAPVPAALPSTANLTLQDKPEPNTQNEPPAITVQPILPPKPEPVVKPQPAPAPVEKPQPVATPEVTTPPPPQKTATVTPLSAPSSAPNDTSEGWIYAGQFIDGAWVERGLVIGEILPAAGQRYALNWGANIRSEPPGKNTSLSETVGYLAQGHTVDILQVKKSGSKGHVWLKIKR